MHPHKPRSAGLQEIPTDPVTPFQLVFWGTEVGELPYSAADNLRGLYASQNLTARMIKAGIVKGAHRVPLPSPNYDFCDPKWAIPQLVLSGALAQFEERYCVAQWCRSRIVELRRAA